MTTLAGDRADTTTRGHRELDQYARSDLGRSVRDLATSVVPFLALWALMFLVFPVSYWLVLLVAIPASGFLVRTYILFHDCVHGSFLSSRRANAWVGTALALLVLTPFARWRYEHVTHHATSGDLDRRGVGDVPVLTVAEYQAKPWWFRAGYRLYRNPVVLFGLGPIYSTVIMQRVPNPMARQRLHRSVWGMNAAVVVLIAALCWVFGWQTVLFVELPLVVLAGGVGLWLFYVQHQYPASYWERTDAWDYTDAALRGSSYLRLPKVLQFFTGNIGFHHVHHLNPKIPNYNLQRAHDEQEMFQAVQPISIWDGLKCARLKLYDEDAGRLVTWRQVPPRVAASAPSAPSAPSA
jgi:omega-6 fatty acid desaturase (delta-12 desaturase)